MNYEQAYEALHHARTKKLLERKKLCNATRLRLASEGDFLVPRLITLELFGKVIITWKPNGNVVLTTAGYKTVTTKDRLNRYMPAGFSVLQEYPYWYLRTPAGVLPFSEYMEVTPEGTDARLPQYPAELDARALRDKVRAYAKFYANALILGLVDGTTNAACLLCHGLKARRLPSERRACAGHLLSHMDKNETPSSLIEAALFTADPFSRGLKVYWGEGKGDDERMRRSTLEEVLDASWAERQKFWRRPTTKKALIEQTELLLMDPYPPNTNIRPHYYRRNFRYLIEDFLLSAFHFEPMHPLHRR